MLPVPCFVTWMYTQWISPQLIVGACACGLYILHWIKFRCHKFNWFIMVNWLVIKCGCQRIPHHLFRESSSLCLNKTNGPPAACNLSHVRVRSNHMPLLLGFVSSLLIAVLCLCFLCSLYWSQLGKQTIVHIGFGTIVAY